MYVDLMVFLFIDVGDNKDVLDGVSLVFEWDQLHPNPYANAAEDRTKSITGAKFEHFPELSDWILRVLSKSDGRLVAEQEEENQFLQSVLQLAHLLVEFGYYVAPEDIHTLMQPLLVILQGTNDVPNVSSLSNNMDQADSKVARRQTTRSRAGSKAVLLPTTWSDADRKGKTSNNSQIVRVKREALNVVDKLINLCLTVRLQNFLYDYKQLNSPMERRQTRASSRVNKPLHPTALTSGPTLTPEQMRALQSILDYTEEKDVDMEDALAPHASVVRQYIDEVSHSTTA
jgi:inositol 1,4,5-triphosphate receptor type 1